MRQTNSSLEDLIQEAIDIEYENAPIPLKAKRATWATIDEQLNNSRNPNSNTPWVKKAIVIAAILLITSLIFSTNQTTIAFQWISKLFIDVTEENNGHISGSIGTPPVDENGTPSISDFQVIEVETKQKMMALPEAQEVLEFDMLVPTEVPDNFEDPLVKVFYANDHVDDQIELHYRDNEITFIIEEVYVRDQMGYGITVDLDDTNVQEVNINDNRGVLFTYRDGTTRLTWNSHKYYLNIRGQLTEEQIIQVARSM